MSQDDKPFVCTASGCGMRFTNEDHLTVHRKKHEMSLALNTGGPSTKSSNSLYLDQTPTPTKFLKNCEEIGLFQELTKNPFDEAFKKSTEVVVENSPLPGPNTAELNTPVPYISKLIENYVKEKPSSSNSLDVVVEDGVLDLSSTRKEVLTGTPPCQPQPTSTTTEEEEEPDVIRVAIQTAATAPPLITPVPEKSNTATTTASSTIVLPVVSPQVATQPVQQNLMQVYLQLPTGQTVPIQVHASQVQQPPPLQLVTPSVQIQKTNCVVPSVQSVQGVVMDGSNRISSTTSPDQSTFTKQKLKAALQNSHSAADQKVGASPDLPCRTIPHVVSPMSTTSASVDGYSDGYDSDEATSTRRGMKRGLDDESDDRRKKFLERNRAAAARCRHKRKQWICSLEKKADDLQNNNNKLQSEVNGLRNEVSHLKTLLLAHKDCPVTVQQQKSQLQIAVQNVAEGSNVILGTSAGSDQRLITADGTAISVVTTLPTSDTTQIASNNPTPNNISLLSSLQPGLIIPSVITSSSDPGGKGDNSNKLS